MKGMIALDIDGTITAEAHALDAKVVKALDQLAQKGWLFIFITGRPFQWGFLPLESLPFPFALAVQNGALLLEMPSRKILVRKYLHQEMLPKLDKISQRYETDFVIYSGLENEDRCYYRPASFPPTLLAYGLQRATFVGEKWYSLQTFLDLPIAQFCSIKFFAKDESALMLSQSIEEDLGLHAPLNRDPFDPDYFVIQATHAHANKGQILKDFIQLTGISGPIIAAGDDHNDRSMLKEADVKVVMANAPAELLALADIVAPPASQLGIIKGLNAAILRLNI